MITAYFYFEHNPGNVRGRWTNMTSVPAVGDEVELWKATESDKVCIVTRRKWVAVDTGDDYTAPFEYVVDIYVKVVDWLVVPA